MASTQPDAIIFVRGIGDAIDQSVDGMAQRIATSFNRNAKSAAAKFHLGTESRDEEYSPVPQLKRKTRVSSIYREDGQNETPVLDIYGLDYRPALTQNYQSLNPLMQSLRLLMTLFSSFGRARNAVVSRAKGKTAKVQYWIALLILLLLVVYMVLLVIAAVGIIWQLVAQGLGSVGQAATAPSIGRLFGSSQIVVVGVAVVQALWPNLRKSVTSAALEYTCLVEYINWGERREVITGQLADLLEYIAERGKYRNIHVISYSFGSIVALDSFFPFGRKPGERFKMIDTLVTIGCPFDLIRMFWPAYFRMRQGWPERPRRWMNVYAPADVFASNFRNDDAEKEAEIGPDLGEQGRRKPENMIFRRGQESISPLAALALAGLRAHGGYWEREPENEVSCFTDIVVAMYSGDPALQ